MAVNMASSLFQWIVNSTTRHNNFILLEVTVAWRTWLYFSSISFNPGEKYVFAGWFNKSWEIQETFSLSKTENCICWLSLTNILIEQVRMLYCPKDLETYSLFLIADHISQLLIIMFLLQMITLRNNWIAFIKQLTMQVHYCLWKIFYLSSRHVIGQNKNENW